MDRVLVRVSVCMCGQSLELCEYLFVWTEFEIMRVSVRMDRVSDCVSVCTSEHSLLLCVSLCTFGERMGSCEGVYVWTQIGIV